MSIMITVNKEDFFRGVKSGKIPGYEYALEMEDEIVKSSCTLVYNKTLKRYEIDAYKTDDDLNNTVRVMHKLGLTKNHEVWRNHFRSIGYSLNGYWEIFYWEVNNPLKDKYEYKSC